MDEFAPCFDNLYDQVAATDTMHGILTAEPDLGKYESTDVFEEYKGYWATFLEDND